jgi:hypothetical protein
MSRRKKIGYPRLEAPSKLPAQSSRVTGRGKKKRLKIVDRAVGFSKGRLKGRLKNNASNKGTWKAAGRRRKR